MRLTEASTAILLSQKHSLIVTQQQHVLTDFFEFILQALPRE